jgi:hypothetical protein
MLTNVLQINPNATTTPSLEFRIAVNSNLRHVGNVGGDVQNIFGGISLCLEGAISKVKLNIGPNTQILQV